MEKILIVEDDNEIAMLEEDYLDLAGYKSTIINDGNKVIDEVLKGDYSLILLDLMLPGKSGYDICRELREKINVPILMVTAKTESADKIRGLGLGADDYISKPFDPAELVARVKSNIRQYERLINKTEIKLDEKYKENETAIEIGNIKILTKGWKVYKGNKEIKFPNREFELLKFLALNPNIVFSKEKLFEEIWGYDYISDNATVTVHINRIREKIEEDPKNPQIIETVWGAGYRLNL